MLPSANATSMPDEWGVYPGSQTPFGNHQRETLFRKAELHSKQSF
jgi:hypothetical protein